MLSIPRFAENIKVTIKYTLSRVYIVKNERIRLDERKLYNLFK